MYYVLNRRSSVGSGTQGPARHDGPKKEDTDLSLDSTGERSSSHSRGVSLVSKYWNMLEKWRIKRCSVRTTNNFVESGNTVILKR